MSYPRSDGNDHAPRVQHNGAPAARAPKYFNAVSMAIRDFALGFKLIAGAQNDNIAVWDPNIGRKLVPTAAKNDLINPHTR